MTTLLSFKDTSASNALFSGDEQFAYAFDIKVSGANVIKESNKTVQPTFTTEDGTGVDKYLNAYDRKKSDAQQTTFTTPVITMKILFKGDEKDILIKQIGGETTNMLNLHKMYHMIRSPRTYYLKEETLYAQLSAGDYAYYNSNGIPVVIKSWSLDVINGGKGDVGLSLTLVEDKNP